MGAGGPIALLLGWLTTANFGLLFAITGLACFLNYELLHFIYHCDSDSPLRKIPGINRLRQLHLNHQNPNHHDPNHHNPRLMQNYNLNISYPIGDWLFVTLYRSPEAK